MHLNAPFVEMSNIWVAYEYVEKVMEGQLRLQLKPSLIRQEVISKVVDFDVIIG